MGHEWKQTHVPSLSLHPIDEEALIRKTELLEQGHYDDPMFDLSREFAEAEEILIAAPHWDLSFPSILKLYLEHIYAIGIVSRYDEAGKPIGLCKAKTLYYVTTSGGPYDPRYSYDYLRTLALDYFGIGETRLFYAENLDIVEGDAVKRLEEALEKFPFNIKE